MRLQNPFEIIYEFNAKYNKYILIFALATIFLILPFTLDGFTNTESSQEEFLSSNSESKFVTDLLNEKFPGRPEGSITLIIKSNNESFKLTSEELYNYISGLQTDLESEPILQKFQIETISLKSIEQEAISKYYESIAEINKSLQENFKNKIIFDTYSSVASIESFVNQTIDLANSIDSFSILPSIYMKNFYDISRIIYYIQNQTTAYETFPSPFNTTHYAILNTTLLNTLGEVGFDLANNSFLASFGAGGSSLVTNNLLDSFSNYFAFQIFNQTLNTLYTMTNSSIPYTQSGLYYISLVIYDNWVSALNTATNGGLNPVTDILQGSSQKADFTKLVEMYSSQGALLYTLNLINNVVLEKSFFNLTINSLNGNNAFEQMNSLFSLFMSGGSSNSLPAFPPLNDSLLNNITHNVTMFGISQVNTTSQLIFPLNESFVHQVVDVAINERTTRDQNVIGNFTLNSALTFLATNQNSSNDFIDFNNDFASNVNQTKIMESFNQTYFIEQSYIAGKNGNLNESLDRISLYSANEIINGIENVVAEPSINQFPSSLTRGFLSQDNSTMLVIINYKTQPKNDDLAEQVSKVREIVQQSLQQSKFSNTIKIYVSGELPINWDMAHSMENDISKIDIVTVILVLVLLSIVFRSFITPIISLLSIGMALMMAVGVLSILSDIQNVSIPSLMIAVLSVIMFGAGIDYCLFVLARYKEERLNGKPKRRAVKEAVLHAGESVTSSGTTVMIGFGSLLLSSFGLLNQMGRGPLIGIAFSLLAALTLIPIALFIFGDKLFWPRNFEKDYQNKKGFNNGSPIKNQLNGNNYKPRNSYFRKVATFTVKNPWKVIVFFLVFTTPFLYLTSQITPSYNNTDLLPTNVESVDGLVVLGDSFPPGELFPLVIVFEFNHTLQTNNSYFDINSINLVENFITVLEHNFTVASDGLPLFQEIRSFSRPNGELVNYSNPEILKDQLISSTMLSFISTGTDNKTVTVNAFTRVDPVGEDSLAGIKSIRTYRDTLLETNKSFSGINIYLGGYPAAFSEIQQTIDGESPYLAAFVLIGVYLVLFILLGSFFTPLRLELTILMSLVVTLGATQFFFVDVLGRGIPWILPIMLFVLIFGLGIDYDIFIVTRIREEIAHKGLTDEEAIINSIESTGSIISTAGIIMASALGSLILASSNILQIMGFAFFVSILLDATIVRVFLVPALMVVMGRRYNWWNPIKSLERVPSESEREKIRIFYHEHLIDEKKRVTDIEVEQNLLQLNDEYKELNYFRKKWLKRTNKLNRYSRIDIDRIQAQSYQINSIIDQIERLYQIENPQMKYTLEGTYNRNEIEISKLKRILARFDFD